MFTTADTQSTAVRGGSPRARGIERFVEPVISKELALDDQEAPRKFAFVVICDDSILLQGQRCCTLYSVRVRRVYMGLCTPYSVLRPQIRGTYRTRADGGSGTGKKFISRIMPRFHGSSCARNQTCRDLQGAEHKSDAPRTRAVRM